MGSWSYFKNQHGAIMGSWSYFETKHGAIAPNMGSTWSHCTQHGAIMGQHGVNMELSWVPNMELFRNHGFLTWVHFGCLQKNMGSFRVSPKNHGFISGVSEKVKNLKHKYIKRKFQETINLMGKIQAEEQSLPTSKINSPQQITSGYKLNSLQTI